MKKLFLPCMLSCFYFFAQAQLNQFQFVHETLLNDPILIGDKIVHINITDEYGTELWVTDGTAAGTTILKDIMPGAEDAIPRSLTRVGEKIFFTAKTAEFGRELWVTDGTEAGTFMVKDINPGTEELNFGFTQLHAFNDQLYIFLTVDPLLSNPEMELWTSDGSEAGTVMLKTLCDCGTPGGIANVGNYMYFEMSNDFYKSDGTAQGTQILTDDSFPNIPDNITAVGDKFYFSAAPGFTNTDEPFVSDGQTATQLADGLDASGTEPDFFYGYNNKVYFSANYKIYVTDGTAEGTSEFADIKLDNPNTGSDNAPRFFEWNGLLYFVGIDNNTQMAHIFRTNGDPNQIEIISDSDPTSAFYNTEFIPTTDFLYVIDFDNNAGYSGIGGDWITVISNESPVQTFNLAPDPATGSITAGYFPEDMILLGDKLLFWAQSFYNGQNFRGMRSMDVNNVAVSINETIFNNLEVYPNPVTDKLFFSKLSQQHDYKVIALNGTTIKTGTITNEEIDVADLIPGIYCVQLKSKTATTVMKFVKQ